MIKWLLSLFAKKKEKPIRSHKRWVKREVNLLIGMHTENKSYEYMAKQLGRSVSSVKQKLSHVVV